VRPETLDYSCSYHVTVSECMQLHPWICVGGAAIGATGNKILCESESVNLGAPVIRGSNNIRQTTRK